jgi:Helicase associated domain
MSRAVDRSKYFLRWEPRWERGFAALSKFRAREGHSRPSRRHVEGKFKLGNWVAVQRYHKDLLSVKRKRRLNAIEFVWDWRDYFWEQNFAALLKFKRREGHCRVPAFHREGDLKLGLWATEQRRKRKIMLAERRARLNKIGFVWNPPVGPIPHRQEHRAPQRPQSSSALRVTAGGGVPALAHE